jgi:hypothetical protein
MDYFSWVTSTGFGGSHFNWRIQIAVDEGFRFAARNTGGYKVFHEGR